MRELRVCGVFLYGRSPNLDYFEWDILPDILNGHYLKPHKCFDPYVHRLMIF